MFNVFKKNSVFRMMKKIKTMTDAIITVGSNNSLKFLNIRKIKIKEIIPTRSKNLSANTTATVCGTELSNFCLMKCDFTKEPTPPGVTRRDCPALKITKLSLIEILIEIFLRRYLCLSLFRKIDKTTSDKMMGM